MDARAWWADMQRDNELTIDGYRVLRFPAFVVRDNPEVVAAQIAQALRRAGRRATEPEAS
jgi:very-short-patch-repair endonuclease